MARCSAEAAIGATAAEQRALAAGLGAELETVTHADGANIAAGEVARPAQQFSQPVIRSQQAASIHGSVLTA